MPFIIPTYRNNGITPVRYLVLEYSVPCTCTVLYSTGTVNKIKNRYRYLVQVQYKYRLHSVQSTRLNGYDLIVTLSVIMVTTFRRIPYISPNPNRNGKGMLWVYALYVPLHGIQLRRPYFLTCARSSSPKFNR
jgi:hypothetical protein